MTSDRNSLRRTLIQNFPREHGQLLPALHFLQHEFGHLPDWAMEVVGWHLGIPASEVYGAATSYTELRVDEPGAHALRVCTGLSCRLAGAGDLVAVAETDGNAMLEETPCAFLCSVAPALQLEGRWHGRATPARLEELLSGLTQP